MSLHPRHAATLLLLLATAACSREPVETYGFVATLGNDTTSVERITRQGNRITSDAIGRSPVVMRRHWEATLAPDGSIRSWTLDTHVPNADAGLTDLHHEAHFDDSTVRFVRHAGSDTTDRTFAKSFAVTVPWNAFLYGTYELLFQAAQGHPDSTRIGQYFFEGWAEGGVGHALLRRLEDGSIAISSTGLAGSGVAQLDPQARLLSYSGEGTTYKQEVRRVNDVPDIDAIAARFADDERARGVTRVLSARDTVRANVGGAAFTIDYSRPLARGRTLVGGLIPYNRVWRTGANAATHMTVSAPVSIAGIDLDAGTYTLWTLPSAADVQLIINSQTGQWGTGYRSQSDLARAPLQVDSTDAPVEQFTIRIEPAGDATSARLIMEWGSFRWTAPIIVRPARATAR